MRFAGIVKWYRMGGFKPTRLDVVLLILQTLMAASLGLVIAAVGLHPSTSGAYLVFGVTLLNFLLFTLRAHLIHRRPRRHPRPS